MLTIKTSNRGYTVRQADPPDVATYPFYKNFVWIKEGSPPTMMVFDITTGLWVLPGTSEESGVVLPQLAVVLFTPADGTLTDGFTLTHETPDVVIWYNINNSDFSEFPLGQNVLVGLPDYMTVAAFATKEGYLDSDTLVVEYVKS
jgi:hypothetical protein